MISATKLFKHPIQQDVRLTEAWQAFSRGRASQEDYEIIMTDLANFTGYFAIAEDAVPGDVLQRYEGKRAVMAHILYSLDAGSGIIGELRRAALDELARQQQEV